MSSLKKNFSYNVIYQILIVILPLITSPYLSRILGRDGLGSYYYTYSIALYFMMFAMLGIGNHGVRSIARLRDDKSACSEEFWSIYLFQAINATIVILCYILYLYIFSGYLLYLQIIQGLFVLSAFFDINWFFFGIEKFKLTVTRNIIIRIISVILIFTFVKTRDDLPTHILITGGSHLLTQVVLWKFIGKYVNSPKIKLENIISHIKPSLILFIPVLAVSIYNTMDKIMLGSLNTMSEVGLYENTEKIILLPSGIIVAFGTVMLPRMSHLFEKDDTKQIMYNIDRSMEFNMFMSNALMFGIAGVANLFMPLFFGEEFAPTGKLVLYLAPVIVFKAWANVIRNQFLIPIKRDHIFIISVIAGAVSNLLVNYLLIPTMGALGAILGTVVAELIVCAIQTINVAKELNLKRYFSYFIKYFIFGLVMFFTVKLISLLKYIILNSFLILVLQIIFGATIYLTLSFFLYDNKAQIIETVKNNIKVIFNKQS